MRSCKRLLLILCSGLLLAAGVSASAAWQVAGAVSRVQQIPEGMALSTSSGASVRLSFVTPDVVRVRMSPTGAFATDFSYALQAQVPATLKLRIDDNAERIELRADSSPGVRVVVQKKPALLITVYDAQNRVIAADDPARPMAFDPGNGAIETSKQRSDYELYYGFGEKALPISRHQQFMTMWNTDAGDYAPGQDPSYQTIPFFIALRGGKSYGVLFDNTWHSYFDMGKTDPRRYTFGADGGELNYFIFTGGAERTPANVLRDYTAMTGRGALPPLWALGYQQSRYSYMSQDKVEQIARTFRQKKIPADVIYMDIDYMDGYRVFTWNPKTFAEPRKLLTDLHDEGFHAVTIIDPGVKFDETYETYRSGKAQGVYVLDGAGRELHEKVWPGICAFPDFTNPKTRAWWGALYSKFLDDGVDGFWNDMNEPAAFAADDYAEPSTTFGPQKTFPLDAQHNGDGQPGPHTRYHNVYGMQMARATNEGLSKLRPDKRPMVLTRAGYAGVQRYSAVWTGDNSANWLHVALTIPMLTNLGVSGVPFVGADVGGFVGSPSAELYTRWLQAAALTPFFRTHSADNSLQREPWTFGADFEAINRASIELRYQLLPTIYTLFAESEQSGIPPMRPLWFVYPDDVDSSLVEDEYLVGKDLLVAPIVHEGARDRPVYFPKGDAWIDWWSGKRYEGGKSVSVAAPLDRLPLYLRAGASIATQPVIQHTGEMKTVPLTITVALGADGKGSIYQDAGDGYAYRKGASRITHITLHGNTLSIQSGKQMGFQKIGAVEFVGVETAPTSVSIDGKPARNLAFDERTKRLHIVLPTEGVQRVSLNP